MGLVDGGELGGVMGTYEREMRGELPQVRLPPFAAFIPIVFILLIIGYFIGRQLGNPFYFDDIKGALVMIVPIVLVAIALVINIAVKSAGKAGLAIHPVFWVGMVMLLPFASLLVFGALPMFFKQGAATGLAAVAILGLPLLLGALATLLAFCRWRFAAARGLAILVGLMFVFIGVASCLTGTSFVYVPGGQGMAIPKENDMVLWYLTVIGSIASGAYAIYLAITKKELVTRTG